MVNKYIFISIMLLPNLLFSSALSNSIARTYATNNSQSFSLRAFLMRNYALHVLPSSFLTLLLQ